jgi:hypothetical protein
MIIAKIDDEAFLDLVRQAPTIAFQKLEYGYAVAAHDAAYYAPLTHPGGGNLPEEFKTDLASYCLHRLSDPHARTLRPTTKPIPTEALRKYLAEAFFAGGAEPMAEYPKARGDHPAVIESECQVVIQAIEEHGRPDLREAMKPAKRDQMSDALDLVVEHAEAARELCEVGKDDQPALIKMHVLQATQALKTTLEMFLKP